MFSRVSKPTADLEEHRVGGVGAKLRMWQDSVMEAREPSTSEAFESLAGRLLVAVPGMLDPNFSRTVVLMLEHTPEGAVGLVLNRPTAMVPSRTSAPVRTTSIRR